MTGAELLKMRDYLSRACAQYDDAIHVMVAKRKAGKTFSLEDHIAGLIYAQLTNQTKWSRIVPHLKEIDELFFHYNPQEIKTMPPTYFSDGLFNLKCGNISTAAQMRGLIHNIEIMEKLADEYGSMDKFIVSAAPHIIVEKLSSGRSPYKLSQMGAALTWEYIRNVGIDGCKPDTHLRRFLGQDRMGSAISSIASIEETISQVEALSEETGLALCAIDNIIWSFCADGYGEICTATPHCERCVVRGKCKYAADHQLAFSYDPNVISYDELRSICEQLGNDPARIGQHILSLIK